jgi:hypothetical protein
MNEKFFPLPKWSVFKLHLKELTGGSLNRNEAQFLCTMQESDYENTNLNINNGLISYITNEAETCFGR